MTSVLRLSLLVLISFECFDAFECLRTASIPVRISGSGSRSAWIMNAFRIKQLQRPRDVQLNSLDDSSTFIDSASIFDDDLPNILGINPIEAAIIVGALYYFYGPTTLYEYAREAGNFVSTYIPIVKRVVSDIFAEFGDYFEEDKERAILKKQGFDVSNIPRRTSNVFERFQQGLTVSLHSPLDPEF